MKPSRVTRRLPPNWLAITKLVELEAEKISDKQELPANDEITVLFEEYLENSLVFGDIYAVEGSVTYNKDSPKPVLEEMGKFMHLLCFY